MLHFLAMLIFAGSLLADECQRRFEAMHSVIPRLPANLQELETWAQNVIDENDEKIAAIAAVPVSSASFDRTILPIDELLRWQQEQFNLLDVYRNFHHHEDLTSIATRLSQSFHRLFRQQAIEQAAQTAAAGVKKSRQHERFLADFIETYYSKFPSFKDEIDDRIVDKLMEVLEEKANTFDRRNKEAELSAVELTTSQVLSITIDKRFRSARGKWRIPVTENGLLYRIVSNAADPALKKAIHEAIFPQPLTDNLETLHEILKIRLMIAEKKGYRSWSEYRLDGSSIDSTRMIKLLKDFLRSTQVPFEDLVKEADAQNKTELEAWKNQEKQKIAAHIPDLFPRDQTIAKLFGVIEKLFAVRIQKTQTPASWPQDLSFYQMLDADSPYLLGTFAIHSHRSAERSQSICVQQISYAGSHHERPFVLVNVPSDESLSLDHLIEISHEMGHALDAMYQTNGPYHLTLAEGLGEFSELPSTLMELVALDPSVITELATLTVPSQRIHLEEALNFQKKEALLDQRMMAIYALMDLQLHQSRPLHPKTLERKILSEYLFPPSENETYLGSFTHISESYDSLYWTYFWAIHLAKRLWESEKSRPGIAFNRLKEILFERTAIETNESIRERLFEGLE